jgi:hypothetical protein
MAKKGARIKAASCQQLTEKLLAKVKAAGFDTMEWSGRHSSEFLSIFKQSR